MIANKRFSKLIKRFNFKIKKVPFRTDILSVQYRGTHMFTIAKKLYPFFKPGYTDMLLHTPHPDYFNREIKAKQWNFKVKQTPYLWNIENEGI